MSFLERQYGGILSGSRDEFVRLFGRQPRMTGKYDGEQRRRLEEQGYEFVSVMCLADDMDSFVITMVPAGMPENPQ